MSKSIVKEETVTRTVAKEPSQYKVLLHNDEKTTMDFVVMLLTEVFHKDVHEAFEIMILVHETGQGIAGIYTREIAEEKTEHAVKLSRMNGYPLVLTFEEL